MPRSTTKREILKYGNPVIPGFHPDPSVCRVGSDFYLVTSSFEYFPGVPIFRSKDLIEWQQIGHCLDRFSQIDLSGLPSSQGIYAPTLRYHEGVFYMTTTCVGGIGNFYVTARSPFGPWSDPILVDQGGIDPSLLFDDDGTVFFTSNGWSSSSSGPESAPTPFGIYQCEIDIETGRKLTETRLIWEGTGARYPEAPHLYHVGEWYYLMIAEGGTEMMHMETIARSRAPYGPFDSCPRNPILSNRSSWSPIQSTGHADLIQAADDTWWIVFLGVRHNGYPPVHQLGRETFLARVTWEDDGWPLINDGQPVGLEITAPNLAPSAADDGLGSVPFAAPPTTEVGGRKRAWETKIWRDDFSRDTLSLEWNFRRNPDPRSWSLTRRPGSLSLSCLPGTISETGPVSFVGRRQEHVDLRVEVVLDPADVVGEANGTGIKGGPAVEPATMFGRCEAGLTVIMNERYHTEIAVRCGDTGPEVFVRRTIGSVVLELNSARIIGDPIVLVLVADTDWYTFGFRPRHAGAEKSALTVTASSRKEAEGAAVSQDGSASDYLRFEGLGRSEVRHHSTEIAGGFTGVYIGMYATSNGDPSSKAEAFYSHFTYRAS